MVRDRMERRRTDRSFRVLTVFAALAALVGTAGAAFSGAPVRHVVVVGAPPASISADRTTTLAARDAARRDDPIPVASHATKRDPHSALLDVPPWLPARMLPTGVHLPVPAPLPSRPWAARTPTQLGRVVIPAIHVDQPIFEGVDQAAFAHGAGHWPGTASPGAWGNTVFGGHRTTQTHPFLDTDKLRAGDAIDFVMTNGWTYEYLVTRVFVVPDDALWIKDQAASRTVTLFTCNPKGSATSRLVTSGALNRVIAPT